MLCISTALSQKISDNNVWLVKKLLEAQTGNNPIFCRFYSNEPLLFWPKDLPLSEPKYNSSVEHFVRIKNELLYPIPGTGRVYKFRIVNNTPELIRIDSTIYFGHNFGALYLNHQDTLFSLGGYGMWHFNGQLRFFHNYSKDWEVKPVNDPMPLTYGINGAHHDVNHSTYFFLNNSNFIDHDTKLYHAKKLSSNTPDTVNIFGLDLKHGNWRKIGRPAPFTQIILRSCLKVGSHPFGELLTSASRNIPEVYVIDYTHNKIYKLRDKNSVNIIQGIFALGNELNPITRSASYFSNTDSSLHVLTSGKKEYTFSMKRADFELLEQPVYTIDNPMLNTIINRPMTLSIGLNILFVTIGLLFVYRKKFKKQRKVSSRAPDFAAYEKDILLQIYKSPNLEIGVAEIDQALGTLGKSVDTQNKRRSVVIRAINLKYEGLTNDSQPLIYSSRIRDDRRIVRYKLDKEKFNNIRQYLNLK
jgi:hypothetical protein